MKKIHILLYLSVSFIFIGIVSIPLFSDGMFMDGLLYSAISHNMSNGLGSFWKPYLSDSVFPEFYEHPPLALGLQSIWYDLFGDSILVERFYSLFTYLVAGIGLVACWKQLGQSIKTGWIPLFFWLIVSNVGWACANNMLENTMTIFVLFSAWACLKGINTQKLMFFGLAGVFLSMALLSKGFVCLYIWALPLSWYLFKRSFSFLKVIASSSILVACTLLPLALLFLFSEDAAHNMISYFNKQVVGSIQNATTVNSRFAIFGEFFQHIIVPLSIAILVLLFSVRRTDFRRLLGKHKPLVYVFTFLLFCGIMPIMISLKQRGFYILTVYPFLGIILALITLPFLDHPLHQLEKNRKGIRIIQLITSLCVIGSFLLSINQLDSIGRDIEEVSDAHKVITVIGPNTCLNICPSEYGNWSKHGYYSRYGAITLIRNEEDTCSYFLSTNNDCIPAPNEYEQIPIDLLAHKLYKKK